MVYIPYINESLNFVGSNVKRLLTSSSNPVPEIKPPLPTSLFCSQSMIVRLGGLSGALALVASAYGAHGFSDEDEKERQIFKTGAYYHLVNSVALLNAPVFKHPRLSASLFIIGTILFSGSCYYVSLTGDSRLSRVAPVGGMTLIFAWLSLVF